ncbi:MAG: transcription termination factor NusA [Deltaproteobacteria bacterium]
MASELGRVIEQVEKDKSIDKAILIEALESALVMAAKKKYGIDKEIEAHFNEELGEIELFQFKTVVEQVDDDGTEISYEEAKELDPDVSAGDSIGVKLDTNQFGRIAAQTAKQVIIQKVRDAERDIIYNEFNIRKGEVVHGECRRVEKGCVVVNLGRTDAILPTREQIPGESFRPHDRVVGYLIDVQQTPRGPKIVLSRTCPELLIQLFKQEVPEVNEGIVQIKSAAREPGMRAKIAVVSTDPDVDPVGACVGVKGSRVQNVVQELRGEKIDIVPWEEDETRFVCNALAPAEVIKVRVDEDNHSMDIVVADNQLSLAIGKRGQNVKLASMLTGWKLDIVSESKMSQRQDDAKELLKIIEGVNDTLAQSLYQYGFTMEQLANNDVAVIATVPGFNEEKAKEVQDKAKELIASGKYAEVKAKQQELLRMQAGPGRRSKSAVDEQLKAEMKALQEKEKTEAEASAEASKEDSSES